MPRRDICEAALRVARANARPEMVSGRAPLSGTAIGLGL